MTNFIQPPTYYYKLRGNISTLFSSNSEAKASELLENIEEIFAWYYMHSDAQILNHAVAC